MTAVPDQARLPRRDFLLIPLIALLTLLALSAAGELAARSWFEESGSETCGTFNAAGVPVMRPNCTSRRKAAEGPAFTNSYNDCGYRAPQSCGTRPAGAVRVAVLGASMAQGMKVRYEDSFAARLSADLGRACGHPVEFQNMGIPAAPLSDIARRMDEALAMRPDLVLLVLTPIEMRGAAPAAVAQAPAAPPTRSWVSRLSDLAYESRILVAAQHLLFQDDATFAKLYLLHGDEADYLRLPLSPAWEQRLQRFDALLGGMADTARAGGTALMVVMAPLHIQTALLDPARRGAGQDPFEIGRRVQAIAARHGALFADELSGFAGREPGAGFYPVDGHMDALGHARLARAMRADLQRQVPAFQGCART